MGGLITLPPCCLFCALNSSAAASAAPSFPVLKPGRRPLPLLPRHFITGSKEHAKQTPLSFFCFQPPLALDFLSRGVSKQAPL